MSVLDFCPSLKTILPLQSGSSSLDTACRPHTSSAPAFYIRSQILLQYLVIIHQNLLQLLIRRAHLENLPGLRIILSRILIKVHGPKIGNGRISLDNKRILEFHTLIDTLRYHIDILVIEDQHIGIHEGYIPLMRYFILDLLYRCDLICIGGLTGIFELYLRHVEAEVRFYYVCLYVFEEEVLVLVVAFWLDCQVFWQLVFEERVLEDLFPGYALFRIYGQHAADQVFYLLLALYVSELERLVQDVFF